MSRPATRLRSAARANQSAVRASPRARPWAGGAALIGNRPRQLQLAIAVVAIAAFCVYLPTILSAEFVGLDDGQYVVQNDLVRRPSLAGVWRIASEVWHPSTVAGYYQPLTMFSLMCDSLLSGRELSATMFHLTNALLHVLNAVLVLLIVRAACGGFVIPAAAALIWALHPIQVESVAWIAQRKTPLATCFALLAMRAHLLYGVTGRPQWRRLTVLAFVLAALAKPTVMFLPVVLLLLDVWPLRRTSARIWVEKWPLWLAMAVTMVVAARSQQSEVGMGVPAPSALHRMALLCAYNTMRFLHHLFWPNDLCVFYPLAPGQAIRTPTTMAALVGVIVAAVICISAWRWSRPLFVCIAAASLQLSLAVGLVAFMQSQVGDRFMYLPLVMLVLLLAAGATRLWRRDHAIRAGRLGVRGGIVLGVAAILVAALTRATLSQQAAWVDPAHFWASILAHDPDNVMANEGVAGAWLTEAGQLLDAGRKEEGDKKLAEALAAVNHAIKKEPIGTQYQTRGKILLRMGRTNEARADLTLALHDFAKNASPDDAAAQQSLAETAVAASDWEVAAAAYRRAIALAQRGAKDSAPLDVSLAKVMLELRQPEAAAALIAKPNVARSEEFLAQSQLVLAGVEALRHRNDAAFVHLANAVAFDPDLARIAARKNYFDGLRADPRWAKYALPPSPTEAPPASSPAASSP